MSRIEDALVKADEKRREDQDGKISDQYVAKNPRRLKRLLFGGTIGILILISASVYLLFYGNGVSEIPPHEQAQPKKPVHEEATKKCLSLPSCIPLGSPDNLFTSTHPGWQRYETDTFEYRVYTEIRDVKAIQVIAKRGRSIPDDFFASFVNQITTDNRFTLKSTSVKGGSIVENGLLGNMAEVLRYRNKKDGTMIAFVVAVL